MERSTSPTSARLALIAVRLAGLWLLVGALAKLLLGTPKDLPEIVRELTPFGLVTTYVLVIGVELAIVGLSWLRPRLAWPVLVSLYLFFEWILSQQLSLGAKSCGCFGASIKVDPWVMVAIDGALFVFLIATRPWKNLAGRKRTSNFLLAPGLALSFLVPWIAIELRTRVDMPPAPVQAGTTAAAPDATGAHPSSEKVSNWIEMDPEHWVGRNIQEIPELTRWLPADQLPLFGKLVLWRQGCDHCAKHLREMATADDGSQPIVLAQLRDPDDLKNARAVDVMPAGPHVTMLEFPEGLTFLVTAPWELRVDGGNVTEAIHEVD